MRKLLLASHGPLARAMRETLQLFCGEDPRVKVLCAYVDEDTMDVNELIDFGNVLATQQTSGLSSLISMVGQ